MRAAVILPEESDEARENREFCERLSERLGILTDHIHEQDGNPRIDPVLIGVGCALLVIGAWSVAASTMFPDAIPISAPVAAVSLPAGTHSLKEGFDPKLRSERCAYRTMASSRILDLGALANSHLLSHVVPFTQVNREFKQLKTLIDIGRGDADPSTISEVDPAFVRKVKSYVTSLEEAGRLSTPRAAFDGPNEDHLNKVTIALEKAERGIMTTSSSQVVNSAKNNQIQP